MAVACKTGYNLKCEFQINSRPCKLVAVLGDSYAFLVQIRQVFIRHLPFSRFFWLYLCSSRKDYILIPQKKNFLFQFFFMLIV